MPRFKLESEGDDNNSREASLRMSVRVPVRGVARVIVWGIVSGESSKPLLLNPKYYPDRASGVIVYNGGLTGSSLLASDLPQSRWNRFPKKVTQACLGRILC